MSNADRASIHSALTGAIAVPDHLIVIDEVDDATLAAELAALGDLPGTQSC